jgi:predicted regulator of Ras-like GTPase activity (Roadblock/LC7/MglB family)
MSEKLVNTATEFRDEIPELEGLLIGKLDGEVLWGDTLKDLNHKLILASASVAVRATEKISHGIDKKSINQLDIELSGGYVTIIVLKKGLVLGFYGEDARAQLGIIKKNLGTFAHKIEKLI